MDSSPTLAVLDETTVRFVDSRKLPGRPTEYQLRWWSMRKGLKRQIGEGRVWLEWAWQGSHLVTSVEAIRRFHRRINGEEI
jgi:hypothetical protein